MITSVNKSTLALQFEILPIVLAPLTTLTTQSLLIIPTLMEINVVPRSEIRKQQQGRHHWSTHITNSCRAPMDIIHTRNVMARHTQEL